MEEVIPSAFCWQVAGCTLKYNNTLQDLTRLKLLVGQTK
jgi:hypothetical protein